MNETYAPNYERGIGGAAMQANQQSYPQAYATKVSDTASRVPELPGAMERLSARLADLHEAVQIIDSRLTGTVARSSLPSKEAGAPLKGAMQTSLGGQLDGMHDLAVASFHQLRDLIDRLEV